jgi:hypothetical protein
MPSILSINPLSGSIYGGTRLIITGNGFDTKSTIVQIDNVNCTIINATINQLMCLTGAHSSANNLNFKIR